MAALWALTGRTDPRPANGADASIEDVVHRGATGQAPASSEKSASSSSSLKSSSSSSSSSSAAAAVAPAEVTVRGRNRRGEALVVTRRRGVGGYGGRLTVTVGGEDLTGHSVRETQATLEGPRGIACGAPLLTRCSVFGQHQVGGLLEGE